MRSGGQLHAQKTPSICESTYGCYKIGIPKIDTDLKTNIMHQPRTFEASKCMTMVYGVSFEFNVGFRYTNHTHKMTLL